MQNCVHDAVFQRNALCVDAFQSVSRRILQTTYTETDTTILSRNARGQSNEKRSSISFSDGWILFLSFHFKTYADRKF